MLKLVNEFTNFSIRTNIKFRNLNNMFVQNKLPSPTNTKLPRSAGLTRPIHPLPSGARPLAAAQPGSPLLTSSALAFPPESPRRPSLRWLGRPGSWELGDGDSTSATLATFGAAVRLTCSLTVLQAARSLQEMPDWREATRRLRENNVSLVKLDLDGRAIGAVEAREIEEDPHGAQPSGQ